MVILPVSDHEAALVLSALGYFDEEVLPHSVPRIELYKLIKYIQETFGFGVRGICTCIVRAILWRSPRGLTFRPMQPITLRERFGVPSV